jgi:hypothetical protein
MYSIVKFATGLLVAFMFVGCAAGGLQSTTSSNTGIPKWYLNPTPSNTQFYYGAAIGETKNEAKLNALSQISSEISVNIESDFEKNIVLTDDSYNKTLKQNTKASVEKMKFTGVKVIETQYINSEYYSYVKVDRSVLFNAQKKVFDQEYKKIIDLWNFSQKNGVFEVIKNQTKLIKLTNNIFPKLPILKAINPSFNQTEYSDKLETILNKTRDIKSKIIVYVSSKNAKNYAEVLKKYISSENINLVENPKNISDKKNLLTVYVSKEAKKKIVKSSNPRLKGAKFASVNITLTTKNYKNKIIAKNIIKVLNISRESYKHAFIKTAKFEREIKKRGTLNTLLDKK